MRHVAVVGAGLMGSAIASVLARQSRVSIWDAAPIALERLPGTLASIAETCALPVAEVAVAATLEAAVADADLVIEAASERLEVKQQLFALLGELAGPHAALATNSSSIRVGQLASVTSHPERVLGTHFFNPPYAVKLVEVVQGERTDVAVVERTMAGLSEAGFHPVHVRRDIPGIIGNRLQHALKREAIALVEAGVCDAETIDTVVKLGFGSRLSVLGPLEQSDLVGLDLTLAIHEQLLPDLDVSSAPQQLLVDLVAEGRLGMRTGQGFREWQDDEAATVRDRFAAHMVARARGDDEDHG